MLILVLLLHFDLQFINVVLDYIHMLLFLSFLFRAVYLEYQIIYNYSALLHLTFQILPNVASDQYT